MKRSLFCFYIIYSLCSLSFGQSGVNSYHNEDRIVMKSKIALDLWEYYSRFHIDSLHVIGVDLLKRQNENTDAFTKAVAYRLLGCYDVRYGEIKTGLELLEISKSIFLNLGDEKLISEAYNEIGIAYLLLGDNETASLYFQNSLKHGRKSGIIGMSYMAEINLAKSRLKSGDIQKAQFYTEHYIRQALDDEKYESVANAYSLLGQIALDYDQEKRAKYCFRKQFEYAKKCNAPFISTRAINNEAILAFMSENYTESLRLFKVVLEQRKKQEFHFYICEAYMNLGNYHFQRGDSVQGMIYLDSCLLLAEKHKLLLNQIEALELLLEYKNTDKIKNQLNELINKKTKLMNDNLKKRKALKIEKNNPKSPNLYLVISIIIAACGILWMSSKINE